MDVTPILLSAGKAERLMPLSAKVPKPAMPLLDLPLAAFALRDLLAAFPGVVVNVRHPGRAVTAALEGFVPPGKALEVLVEQPEPYGTAGTLRALAGRIGGRALTRNCDLLADLDPLALLETHERIGRPATIAVQEVPEGADVALRGELAAGAIDRRESPKEPGARFLGVAILERECLDLIPDRRPAGLWETVLGPLVGRAEVAVHRHGGYALDVGTFDRYLAASLDLMDGLGPAPPVPYPGEILEMPGGRAYVGPGTHIYKESLGPGAVVLAGATVARDATVERTIVWPGETVGPETKVVDCVWALGRAWPIAE
jgi:mannose-1-phosphate guanylyltransferase